MTPLVALVAALAVYRLTLLLVADTLTQPLRQQLLDRLRTYSHTHVVTYVREPFDGETLTMSATCSCGQGWRGHADRDGEWPAEEVERLAQEHLRQHDDLTIASESRWAYLLTCAWCSSVWLAVPVLWSAWCFGDRAWWFVPAAALAASGVTGAMSQHAAP